jgi:hypothetical protein
MAPSAHLLLDRLIAFRDTLDIERRKVPRANGSAACAKLDHAIAVLTARLNSYDTAVVNALLDTRRRWELRHEIRDAIRPVVTIARTTLQHVPELAILRLPHTGARVAVLVSRLHQLADTVTRHQRIFEREGLATGTADRLRALARRMSIASRPRDISRHGNRRTRGEIMTAIRRGREAVKVLATLMADERSAR